VSVISQPLSYRLNNRDSIAGSVRKFLSLPPRPDWLWGPISLLSNGYLGFFPLSKAAGGVKLATHLHLVPGLMLGDAPPLPNTSSLHGAYLSKR